MYCQWFIDWTIFHGNFAYALRHLFQNNQALMPLFMKYSLEKNGNRLAFSLFSSTEKCPRIVFFL